MSIRKMIVKPSGKGKMDSESLFKACMIQSIVLSVYHIDLIH